MVLLTFLCAVGKVIRLQSKENNSTVYLWRLVIRDDCCPFIIVQWTDSQKLVKWFLDCWISVDFVCVFIDWEQFVSRALLNHFKGNIRETSERHSGAHIAFFECIDTVLNWTALSFSNKTLLQSVWFVCVCVSDMDNLLMCLSAAVVHVINTCVFASSPVPQPVHGAPFPGAIAHNTGLSGRLACTARDSERWWDVWSRFV